MYFSSVVNPTCYGGNDGIITITPTGGTPGSTGYSISWNTVPVQTTATITNLSAGQYFVTITDSLGCSVVKCIKVIDPAPLVVELVLIIQCYVMVIQLVLLRQ